MGHVALLLEPLQAGIVRVELEWAVQKLWAENLQSVHNGEQQLTFATMRDLRVCWPVLGHSRI